MDLRNHHAVRLAIQQITDHGVAHCDETGRQEICATVATALDLDFEAIKTSRRLSLLTPDKLDQLDQLDAFSIDVQLHTHRHRFPANNPEQARRELQENRNILEKISGHHLEHFCYPGGNWTPDLFPTLTDEGVVSATTCEAGMNHKTTNPLALYRILDQNNLDNIEFEAELTGFCEMLRVIRGRGQRNDRKHGISS